MPWPWRPGMRVTADRLEEIRVQRVELAADTAGVTNNNTTLVTTGLVVPVVAGGLYRFTVRIAYGSAVPGGIGIGWSVPSGTDLSRHVLGVEASQNAANGTVVIRARSASTTQFAGGGLTFASYWEDVRALIGGTGGNCTLMYSQANASATATIVRALSYIEYQRIA